MLTDPLVSFFLPAALRADQTQPRYAEFYAAANASVCGTVVVSVGAAVMHYVPLSPWGFYLNGALGVCILLSMRLFEHYRLPMSLTALATLSNLSCSS